MTGTITSPSVSIKEENGVFVFHLQGSLTTYEISSFWNVFTKKVLEKKDKKIIFDLTGLQARDTAGMALLLHVEELHGEVGWRGLNPELEKVLDRLQKLPRHEYKKEHHYTRSFYHAVTQSIFNLVVSYTESFAFAGETFAATLFLIKNRRMLRFRDISLYAQKAGTHSLPLVLSLGLILGVILTMQSVIPLKQFGAEIFVANLVTMGMIREIGPMMTAIILAGRTGSAFAAEIGTMQVNQEIDALKTMGIDPITYLVWPRIIAVIGVVPFMTVFFDLAGIAAMYVVMLALGFSSPNIMTQIITGITVVSFFASLLKSVVFGSAVAAIGCNAGMRAQSGPRAVGEAATRAVVGGIVASIILDGVLAIIFYRLGI